MTEIMHNASKKTSESMAVELEGMQSPMGKIPLFEQVTSVFLEPKALFKKLRNSPSCAGAFLLICALNVLGTLCWAIKVDPEAATARKMNTVSLAFHVALPQDAVAKAVDSSSLGGRFYVDAFIGLGIGLLVGSLILALLLLFLAKNGGQAKGIGFKHAWAVSVVHGIVLLPTTLLGGAMCLIRGAGSASSFMALAPTNPSYFLAPGNPWDRGLLSVLDPFYLFSFVTLYFAARYTLELKGWAIGVLFVFCGVFGIALRIFAGMF